jgi:hypothetical protein
MNSNSEIYSKYIKYKNKYINLQNKINIQQTGGSALASGDSDASDTSLATGISESIDAKTFFGLPEFDENKYIPIKTRYTINGKDINLFNIELNKDEDKPVLFMLAGVSEKSFKKSSKILLEKLDVLTNKFKNIYMIEYSSFGDDQTRACGLRDGLDESNELNKTKDDIYKPELDMNSEIADNVHNIIKSLGLTNVHLLGKCNGAWITILLLLKSSRYKALYLAVPGIPSSVEILKTIDITRLQTIKFIFGWTQQDGFVFNWKNAKTKTPMKSYQEKERYDKIIEDIKRELGIELRYESFMYDNKKEEDDKVHHEIYTDMIDEISSR